MRRFDIIRTGILPEVAVENRKVMTAIITGIRNNGYYTSIMETNSLPIYGPNGRC